LRIHKVASMTVSLLGSALGFGAPADQSLSKDKKSTNSPFASLFQAASSQARRTADKSILDSARETNSSASIGVASHPTSEVDLRRDAEAALGNLNRRLQQLCAENDVDTSVDVHLAGNGSGGVQVAGSHPDEDTIRDILADHPEVAQQFHEMMALFAKLQASSPSSLGAAPTGALTMIVGQQSARVALEPAAKAVE